MVTKEYPCKYIKGVPNKKDIVDDVYIGAHVFEFRENPDRADKRRETSVNWYDDEGAVTEILQKKKANDSFQFSGGYAVLETHSLREIIKLYKLEELASFERAPLKNINEYHGNIFVNNEMKKKTRGYFQATLAMRAAVTPR